MAPLRNQRHEAFARGLFENLSADEAYEQAGYQRNRHNASRLKTKETISTRLAELQREAQKKSEVTVASLLEELEHARERADSLNQLSASVKAISEKAKISGLLIERQQVEVTGNFNDNSPPEVIIAEVLKECGPKRAWHLCLAFDLNPADYGIARNGAEDQETRQAPAVARTFEPPAKSLPPPVSQYASEERRPKRNGR